MGVGEVASDHVVLFCQEKVDLPDTLWVLDVPDSLASYCSLALSVYRPCQGCSAVGVHADRCTPSRSALGTEAQDN